MATARSLTEDGASAAAATAAPSLTAPDGRAVAFKLQLPLTGVPGVDAPEPLTMVVSLPLGYPELAQACVEATHPAMNRAATAAVTRALNTRAAELFADQMECVMELAMLGQELTAERLAEAAARDRAASARTAAVARVPVLGRRLIWCEWSPEGSVSVRLCLCTCLCFCFCLSLSLCLCLSFCHSVILLLCHSVCMRRLWHSFWAKLLACCSPPHSKREEKGSHSGLGRRAAPVRLHVVRLPGLAVRGGP